MEMIRILPNKLISLAKRCPFPLYVVGGTCRNFFANLNSSMPDYDICAPTTPEQFCEIVKEEGFIIDGVYKNTGTIKLHSEKDSYEFSTFRNDEYVRGVHSPVKTYLTTDLSTDALRRDFKCNAIYYDIKAQSFIDPLGGINDVKNGVINTVREPERVFGQDGLRLMRLARHCAETGLIPTESCIDGARKNRYLIKDVSAERVWTELNAILHADLKYGVIYGHYSGLKVLRDTGVLEIILPELWLGNGMKQNPKYHAHDVLTHSLLCAKYAQPSIRLAALLHDVGKPQSWLQYLNFHHHDEMGAEILYSICQRLKAPKATSNKTSKLIALHMYDCDGNASENKVRRFIVRHHYLLPELLALKQADYSASKDDERTAPVVAKWQRIYDNMKREKTPFTLKELNVKGDQLIIAGIKPEAVSKTLNRLLEECATDATLNKTEKLIKRAFINNN